MEPLSGTCFRCGRPVPAADGCVESRTIHYATDEVRDPLPFGDGPHWDSSQPPPSQCGNCGAAAGNYHHPGCGLERCPRCGERYLGCDCESAEKRRIADE